MRTASRVRRPFSRYCSPAMESSSGGRYVKMSQLMYVPTAPKTDGISSSTAAIITNTRSMTNDKFCKSLQCNHPSLTNSHFYVTALVYCFKRNNTGFKMTSSQNNRQMTFSHFVEIKNALAKGILHRYTFYKKRGGNRNAEAVSAAAGRQGTTPTGCCI